MQDLGASRAGQRGNRGGTSWHRVWAASGALALVLFLAGLVCGDLLGSSNYPPLNARPARVASYFVVNGAEVRLLAFCHLLSAVALLGFFAYLYEWLTRDGGASRRVAAAALAGGVTGAAFLALSALTYRTLAEPAVATDAALAHALVVISYLAGGAGIAAPLALPLAAASLCGGAGALPRAVCRLGLLAAAVSLLSAVTLLGPMDNSSIAYGVLLAAAVLGFTWIATASVLLALRVRGPRPQAHPVD